MPKAKRSRRRRRTVATFGILPMWRPDKNPPIDNEPGGLENVSPIGIVYGEDTPERASRRELRQFLLTVAMLKAMTALKPDEVLVLPEDGLSDEWWASEELRWMGVAESFQRQRVKRGHKCDWVCRLTPLGRKLVEELNEKAASGKLAAESGSGK